MRRSEEVLAGMFARTGRDAHTPKPGHQHSRNSTSGSLFLLRAGCPRPAVQHLYKSGEVGLGQAMGLVENGNISDSDSGISAWASCDDGDTAAFEDLLEEENRAARRLCGFSPPSSPSLYCSPQRLSPRSPRVDRDRRPTRRGEKTELTVAPQARPAPVFFSNAIATTMATKSPTKAHRTSPEESSSVQQREPTTVPQIQLSPFLERITAVPSSELCPSAPLRSAGVQCSGPPIDQGVQTSALRLPRKTAVFTDRIFHAKLPPEANVDQHVQEVPLETAERVSAAENGQQRLNETSSIEMVAATAAQVHVRVGLEGMQDANREQRPIVWAVARREDSRAVGSVIMLPLEDGDKQSCVRRFLKVADFTNGRGYTEHGTDFSTRVRQDEEKEGPSAVADSDIVEELEHEPKQQQEEEEEETLWRTSRLDPLWEGLGSLGERLAGVDGRFDRLDEEICHDREVIESYQREAQEGADMAAKDLASSWARRVACPAKNRSDLASQGLQQVPWWRRTNATDLEGDSKDLVLRIGIPPAKQNLLSTHDRGTYRDGGDGDEGLPSKEAALQAEEELRAARAILQSIEEELRPDTEGTPAGSVAVVASTAVSDPVKEAGDPSATPRMERPACLPAGRGNHTNSKHFQRPRFQPNTASRRERKSQAASSNFTRRGRSKESRRLGRTGLAMGADVSVRSVGTVVAHFPTAVATKSTLRGKATKRAWG